jgi:lipopolysaccharide exporter
VRDKIERTGNKHVARGVFYTLIGNYAARFVNLAITVVVARAVGPAGMGVVAAALLTVEIVDTIRDFGLREALIYEPDLSDRYRNSAFFVIQAVSMVQALAMVAIALAVGSFGFDPMLATVLLWLAILFPLSALGSPQEAMLQREGAFGRRASADIISVIVKAVAVIGLVWMGWGIWAIIVGMILGIGTRTLTLWLQSSWKPRLRIPHGEDALALIRYGKHIIASNIMQLMRMKVDQFVVAAILSPSMLGAYFLAARVPEIAIYGVNVAITTVAFPSFSKVVREKGLLQEAYLRAVRSSMLLMVPVAIGISVTSGQIVNVFFGPQWHDAIPVLGILSLGGIALTMGWSSGNVFKATGRPELLTMSLMIEVLVCSPIVACVVLLTRDVVWISSAMVASEIGSCALRLYLMSRYENTSARRTLMVAAPVMAASVIMGLVVYFSAQQMTGLSPSLKLAASVLIGIFSYAILILTIDRESVAEVRALLSSRSGRPEAVPKAAAEDVEGVRTVAAALEAPVATPAARTEERPAPIRHIARSTPQHPPALGADPVRTDIE